MIKYELKRTKRKTIGIQITIEGAVIVTAPYNVSERMIRHVIKEKEAWIRKKQEDIQKARKQLAGSMEFLKDKLLYLGTTYPVDIVLGAEFYKMTAGLYGEKIYIMACVFDEIKMKHTLEEWYRIEAKKIIEDRVALYQEQIGVIPNSIRIKAQKTRWGSASTKGNLNFNWRLIMAPVEVIDYVVIHELCHLKEMNHSKAFWSLVETCDSNYKKHRNWLKEHGALLEASIHNLTLVNPKEKIKE